jgi:hydrogenase large subunit
LDFVRAIRSFDPCLPCAVHVQFVEGNRIVKDVEKVLRQVECPI